MNHRFKLATDWKPQHLPEIINTIHGIVKVHFPDLQRALYGMQGRIQGGGGEAIGKNTIFWRKIVIFTRNTPKFFAPPSARRNFFKCAPLT